MQLFHFLVSASLLISSSCAGQAVNLACPTSHGTTGNGGSTVTRSVEVMYRSGTTDREKRKIRSALCTTSVKNLGSPDQELLVVQVDDDDALNNALNAIQKNRSVISARLSSKSYIK
jgi:hypothetical protein